MIPSYKKKKKRKKGKRKEIRETWQASGECNVLLFKEGKYGRHFVYRLRDGDVYGKALIVSIVVIT